MRIGVNASFWTKPQTGSGQYLHELVRAMAECSREDESVLFLPERGESDPGRPRVSLSAVPPALTWGGENLAKVWFEQVTFPRVCRHENVSLAHVPYFGPPLFPSTRTVVTIHDLIPIVLPHYHGSPLVQLYTRLASMAAKKADAVIADSECTRRDIVERLGIPAARVHVIYLAANARYQPTQTQKDMQRVRTKFGLPEKMLLYLGGYDRRKNTRTLLEMWQGATDLQREGYCLVLAGALPEKDSDFFPDPRRSAREMGINPDTVRYIGRVDEEDKPALYASASVFLFPSLYEGFGLPPLEAMACGTPVICSRAGSLPEVVGEAALSVDPIEASQWQDAVIRVLGNAALRDQMKERGLTQAAQFSWQRAARETAAVYRGTIAT